MWISADSPPPRSYMQISDLHFRRQVLLQLLILFNYLKTYMPSEKDKWAPPRGARVATRPRRLDLSLTDEDSQWVKDMFHSAIEEIRSGTGSVGFRVFADTVNDLLDREKAWVRFVHLLLLTERSPNVKPLFW